MKDSIYEYNSLHMYNNDNCILSQIELDAIAEEINHEIKEQIDKQFEAIMK